MRHSVSAPDVNKPPLAHYGKEKAMTREQALRVLDKHNIRPEEDMTVMGNDAIGFTPIQGTSFDAELGIREEYDARKVYAWLGY